MGPSFVDIKKNDNIIHTHLFITIQKLKTELKNLLQIKKKTNEIQSNEMKLETQKSEPKIIGI